MERLEGLTPSIFSAFFVCEREAWLLYNGITSYDGHPLLKEGRVIHNLHHNAKKGQSLLLDGIMQIDVLTREAVVEIKKSSRHLLSARKQLLFELFYLKHEKGIEREGEIVIPDERKSLRIKLTPKEEKLLEKEISEVEKVVTREHPPAARRKKVCKSCSYFFFCFGDEE